MLQFDLQFYEELTVARVKTVKFISGAFFLADRSACVIISGVITVEWTKLKVHDTSAHDLR